MRCSDSAVASGDELVKVRKRRPTCLLIPLYQEIKTPWCLRNPDLISMAIASYRSTLGVDKELQLLPCEAMSL